MPPSKGLNGAIYNVVLVVVDRFLKYVRYFPVNDTIDAASLADLLYTRIVYKLGPLEDLVLDRGSIFTSIY